MENQEHIHQFEDTVVPATCRENGYTVHKCACGYSYQDNYTEKIGHRFEVEDQKDPTCTKGGTQQLRCAVCGAEETRECPPLGHKWGKWNVRTVPTCTEEGSQSHTCDRCGVTEKAEIKPLGHKLKNGKKSATKKGCKDYLCVNCGQVVTKKTAWRKLRNWLIGLLIAAILLVGGYFAITKFVIPNSKYNKALDLMNDKKYEDAIEIFEELEGYKDSDDKIEECAYNNALILLEEGKYKESYLALKASYGYKDSAELLKNFFVVYASKTDYNADGNKRLETKYEYDENGNEISRTYYDADGNKESVSKHEYDENGNQISVTRYDADGNKEWVSKREYDENGNQISVTYYNADGNKVSVYKYEYDKYGNQISGTGYDADGNKVWESKCEYDGIKVFYKPDQDK